MGRLIIGLGSGRCGTASLAHLLNLQEGASVTHEFCSMPWEFDKEIWAWNMGRLLFGKWPYDTDVIGDVGFYWVNYIERLLEKVPETKFICLKRDRQEVVESMWKFTSGLNVHPTDERFRMYPRYDAHPKDAVGLMWDDYCKITERWQGQYPEYFKIMDMDMALNDKGGVREMLVFLGIKNPVIKAGIRLNARQS
jgi:hypothetical protein